LCIQDGTSWNVCTACIAHLDIKDGRIWIQYDETETGIADELAELGVPKEDIILAYHPPYKRPYTGFGPANQH
jgi:hypothetical protein